MLVLAMSRKAWTISGMHEKQLDKLFNQEKIHEKRRFDMIIHILNSKYDSLNTYYANKITG